MTRWLLIAALAVAAHEVRGADAGIATYTATYRVEYKGKEAGVSDWSVRPLGDGRYEFLARITPKGMLKLIRPKPTIERSQFRLEGNALFPLEYWFEDGSRSGEDNWHLVFDWERRVATVSTAEARRELTVPDTALDIGTLKVAVMRDLAVKGAGPTRSPTRTRSAPMSTPTAACRRWPPASGLSRRRSSSSAAPARHARRGCGSRRH
jgi:hypothetical protein